MPITIIITLIKILVARATTDAAGFWYPSFVVYPALAFALRNAGSRFERVARIPYGLLRPVDKMAFRIAHRLNEWATIDAGLKSLLEGIDGTPEAQLPGDCSELEPLKPYDWGLGAPALGGINWAWDHNRSMQEAKDQGWDFGFFEDGTPYASRPHIPGYDVFLAPFGEFTPATISREIEHPHDLSDIFSRLESHARDRGWQPTWEQEIDEALDDDEDDEQDFGYSLEDRFGEENVWAPIEP